MRRREFLTLLSGAAVACPLAARAQQAGKLPTIGFLGDGASAFIQRTAAFVERLRELGWIEGRTIAIEYRWSEGHPERVAEIAAEFVQQKVDVLVAYGGAVATLKQASTSIPIVFAIAIDPIGSGLVASLSRPGGNVTGFSDQQTNSCVSLSPVSAGWQLCLMPAIPRRCEKWATPRMGLAASALKSRHMRSGDRRILRPFLMLSKVKRTHFMSLKMLCSASMARASPRLHSTCSCRRPSYPVIL
jgi:hypothetical protein